MSFQHLRRMIGRLPGSRSNSKRVRKQRRLRTLISETLEPRHLLAGDLGSSGLMPHHNYIVAEDVNADFEITPSDALIVLNELTSNGAGEFDSSRPSDGRYTDVNGDGRLTPVDPLIVLNRLTRGEGIGELLELKLDVKQNGTSIVDENRNFEVEVGEKFDLEILYDDLRGEFDRLGVFSLYVDILATQTDAYLPVLSETQIIELSENLEDATGGGLTLSFANNPGVTAVVPLSDPDVNVPTLQLRPELAIQNAIEQGLGFGEGTISVTEGIRSQRSGGVVGTGDPFRYTIRFIGDDEEFVNVSNLQINTATLEGTNVVGSMTEIPVFTDASQTQLNPSALLFNVDYRSSSFGDLVVYSDVRSGAYNPGNSEAFNEVGAVGPAEAGGLRQVAIDQGLPPFTGLNFEAFSIEMIATRAQENVRYTIDLPDSVGSEISLYGFDNNGNAGGIVNPALTADQILIDLDNDPSIAGDDRFGLVQGTFVINPQPGIVAVVDPETVPEDSPAVDFDVLSNDVNNGTGTLTLQSISNPTGGKASLNGSQITYQPNPDFFGTDVFTYTVANNEDAATGTVSVTVVPVNDPPVGQDITVSVRRGGRITIPYTSFLAPQPTNEGSAGIVTVTAGAGLGVVASDNNVNKLIYDAPNTNVTGDVINVQLSDGVDATGVTITVNITDAGGPQAVDDQITTNEDATTIIDLASQLFGNDIVDDDASIQLSSIGTQSTLGTVTPNGNGTITYDPPSNVFGVAADTFTYVISDGADESDPATVTVNLNSVNDPPTALDATAVMDISTTGSIVIDLADQISPGLGETGIPGQTVRISEVGPGSRNGTIGVRADGRSIDYAPQSGVLGDETFSYTVTDQLGFTAMANVTVTVIDSGSGGVGGTGSIQGTKYHDQNDNNARDPGEPALAGWTIYLDQNNNNLLDAGEISTVTDANGNYAINNLRAGNYTVREVNQDGWRQTFPLASNPLSFPIETGNYVGYTTIVDFDGDGDDDIIVANDYSSSTTFESSISLLRNDGPPTFTESILPLPNNSRPQAFAVADFTGDGIVDLAVASAGTPSFPTAGSNGIHLFAGTGNGFSAPPQFIASGDGPSDIVAADLDGDGNIDLATVNLRSNNVAVHYGNGAGVFALPQFITVGAQPVALAAGDLTGDGRPDLAVANYDSGTISIVSGIGRSLGVTNTVSGLTNPTDVLIANIDNDATGHNDLAVTDSATQLVQVFIGNGNGGFGPGSSTPVGPAPEAISAEDINDDGRLDLLIANRTGDASLLRNNVTGTFTDVTNLLVGRLPGFTDTSLAKSIAVGILDGDDQFDYVIGFVSGGINVHTTGISNEPGAHRIELADGQASIENDFGNFQFAVGNGATVALTASPISLTETASTGTNSGIVTATLSEIAPQDVIVTLASSGNAGLNTDFMLGSNQITIPAGSLSASTTITAIDDPIPEPTEQAVLSIDSVFGAATGSPSQASINIVDNDVEALPTVTLSFNPSVVAEGNVSIVAGTLSKPSSTDVIVRLSFAGTAVPGSDYTAQGQFTIPAGTTTRTFTLSALSDGQAEDPETVIIGIESLTGATQQTNQSATLTIVDQTVGGPAVTLTSLTDSVPELNGVAQIRATIPAISATDVVVTLGFSGTATLNTDYVSPPTIVIPAGQTERTISINTVDDAIDDPDETVIVSISSVSNGQIAGGAQSGTFTIVDDDPPGVTLASNLPIITEDGGIAEITATLSSPLDTDTPISLDFTGGTAILGVHFTVPASQQIVIPAGETSGRILVQAINNQTIENDNLQIGVGLLGGPTDLTITIRNEDGIFFP